jgi:hypothetical protein
MSEAKGADLLFTELADAVRYSQNWERSIKDQDAARTRAKKQIEELDILSARITKSFDGLVLDQDTAAGLDRKVNEFVSLATQQVKDKVKANLKASIEDAESEARSEELKAKRSLAAYLAASPLPVIEEEVILELSESSYEGKAEYKCAGEIEYEFILNTASTQHFRTDFAFAGVRKGMRLPVRLGKTWLRREPVPDFEKLDEYVLSKAKASRAHMEATFLNHETGSTVGFVFSRSGSEGFTTIEYTDGRGTIDVTGEAGLSKYIDLAMMNAAMGKLLDAINELSKHKMQLSRLQSGGEDVLATLDCLGFMEKAVAVIVQSKEYLEAMRKVNPKMAVERLKLLGPAGNRIMESLGLTARGVK